MGTTSPRIWVDAHNFILSDFPDFSDFDAIVPMGAPVYDHFQIDRWCWPRSSSCAEPMRPASPC